MMVPVLTNFIAAHPKFSRALFELHGSLDGLGKRLGKGEVLVYFLFDDVTLGGAASSVDILKDGEPFMEVKCASKCEDRWINFFMGMDEVSASLRYFYKVLKLFEKNDRLGKLSMPRNFVHISKRSMERLSEVSAAALIKAEEEYLADLMETPIGTKPFLFFDSQTALPFYAGLLTPEQLKIERISGGLTRLSFKP